ncbi:hypothetical protein BaRGS_00023370 [Batillaria attramentaria]|uniref:Uncharacterized protein n=1 Tax=Batillaria attramentaria TaxID=370345 RepID=A0ABD0KEQ3_9CAEN
MQVIKSLCTLFKRQANLRSANLAFSQLNKDEGIRILESLALSGSLQRRHKQFLTVLDLQEFFSPRTRVLSSSKFAETMGLFLALTSLCMDKRYLNEDVLEKLTSRSCTAPLRYLQLVADSMDPVLDHPISRRAWVEAVHRDPDFTVGVLFLGLTSFDKYASVLIRGMPLTWMRLSWLGVVGPVHPAIMADVEKLLRHVAYNFSDTIIRVQICLWPEAVVPVDEALVNLVSRCHLLRELSVTCRIVPETLDKIEAVLASRQDNVLETMELRLVGFTQEMTAPGYIRRRWPSIKTMAFC